MRILAAVSYILLHFVRIWLGSRLAGHIQRWERRSISSLSGWLLSTLMVLLLFIQYFIITGSFPIIFVGLLVGITILLQGFVYVFRAVLGLDSSQKILKIDYLSLLWGATSPKLVSIAIEMVGICYLFWPIAVLWMYFSSYATHLEREIQLSMFHFCIPAIAGQVMLC